jgi:hypothetical protein
MNERIRELLKQSCGFEYDEDGHELTPILVGKDLAKFAELIVRECVTLADKESERYSNLDQEYCSMAMDNYRELVRKHFGVEDRAVPILSADEQALFAGIASSKLFTIAGAKKQFGVEE